MKFKSFLLIAACIASTASAVQATKNAFLFESMASLGSTMEEINTDTCPGVNCNGACSGYPCDTPQPSCCQKTECYREAIPFITAQAACQALLASINTFVVCGACNSTITASNIDSVDPTTCRLRYAPAVSCTEYGNFFSLVASLVFKCDPNFCGFNIFYAANFHDTFFYGIANDQVCPGRFVNCNANP